MSDSIRPILESDSRRLSRGGSESDDYETPDDDYEITDDDYETPDDDYIGGESEEDSASEGTFVIDSDDEAIPADSVFIGGADTYDEIVRKVKEYAGKINKSTNTNTVDPNNLINAITTINRWIQNNGSNNIVQTNNVKTFTQDQVNIIKSGKGKDGKQQNENFEQKAKDSKAKIKLFLTRTVKDALSKIDDELDLTVNKREISGEIDQYSPLSIKLADSTKYLDKYFEEYYKNTLSALGHQEKYNRLKSIIGEKDKDLDREIYEHLEKISKLIKNDYKSVTDKVDKQIIGKMQAKIRLKFIRDPKLFQFLDLLSDIVELTFAEIKSGNIERKQKEGAEIGKIGKEIDLDRTVKEKLEKIEKIDSDTKNIELENLQEQRAKIIKKFTDSGDRSREINKILINFIGKWDDDAIRNLKKEKKLENLIEGEEDEDDEDEDEDDDSTSPKNKKKASTSSSRPLYEELNMIETKKHIMGAIPKYMMEIDEVFDKNSMVKIFDDFVGKRYKKLFEDLKSGNLGTKEKIIYYKNDVRVDIKADHNSRTGIDTIEYSLLPSNLAESIGDHLICRGTPRDTPDSLFYSIFYCLSDKFRSLLNVNEQLTLVYNFRRSLGAIFTSPSNPVFNKIDKYFEGINEKDIILENVVPIQIRETPKNTLDKTKLRDFLITPTTANLLTKEFIPLISILFEVDIYLLNLRTQVVEENLLFDKYTRDLQSKWRILAMEDGMMRTEPSVIYDPAQLYGTRPIIVLAYSEDPDNKWHRFMPVFYLHGNPYRDINLSYRQFHQYVFNPSDMYIAQLRTYYLKQKFNPFHRINVNPTGKYKLYVVIPLDSARRNQITNKDKVPDNVGYEEDTPPTEIQLFDMTKYSAERKLEYKGVLKITASASEKKKLTTMYFRRMDYYRMISIFSIKLEEKDIGASEKKEYEKNIKTAKDSIDKINTDIEETLKSVNYIFSLT
jgi:hypothetical protein